MRSKILTRVLPVTVLLVVVGFTIYDFAPLWWDPGISDAAKKSVEETRADGLPVSMREYLASFPVPEQNQLAVLVANLPGGVKDVAFGQLTNSPFRPTPSDLIRYREVISKDANNLALGVLRETKFEGRIPLPETMGGRRRFWIMPSSEAEGRSWRCLLW